MQKADLTTRAIAGFVDLLIVIGLSRLPDVLGFLSSCGYILFRDGVFQGRSPGKKLTGVAVSFEEDHGQPITYRESLIRNVPLAAAYILFLIPYAGWILGPLSLVVEWLVALGDDKGMRIGDMLAKTWVVQPKTDTAKTGQTPASQPADLPSGTSEKQESITITETHSERPEQDENN